MKCKCELFGERIDDRGIEIATLENSNGISVDVLNFGGVIYSFRVPDRQGNIENITANHETVAEYRKYRNCFGSLIGRFGNRISGGRFTLSGELHVLPINNPTNCLHGGKMGFDQVFWEFSPWHTDASVGLTLSYNSKNGEEDFPGALDVEVVYELDDENRWTMDYRATTDRPTIVNPTNHAFWNLF